MASTFTYAATRTFTRLELIKTQVHIALRRTTNTSPKQFQKIFDKGIDNHWISKINIYGIDANNYCRAQLSLEIDWDEYNLQMALGKVTVVVSENLKDHTVIELDEVITLFNKYVSIHSLKTEWMITLVNGLNNRNEVLCQLGLVDAEPIKWKTNKLGQDYQIPEISELRVGCYLAGD